MWRGDGLIAFRLNGPFTGIPAFSTLDREFQPLEKKVPRVGITIDAVEPAKPPKNPPPEPTAATTFESVATAGGYFASGTSFEVPVVINAAGAWANPLAATVDCAAESLTPYRRHLAWADTLDCPIMTLDSGRPVSILVHDILETLDQVRARS